MMKKWDTARKWVTDHFYVSFVAIAMVIETPPMFIFSEGRGTVTLWAAIAGSLWALIMDIMLIFILTPLYHPVATTVTNDEAGSDPTNEVNP